MRHALIALTLLLTLTAFAASAAAPCSEATIQPVQTTAADFSVSSIGTDSLAAEVVPLYGVAMVIFGTAGLFSMMFRRQRGPLQLNLTRS